MFGLTPPNFDAMYNTGWNEKPPDKGKPSGNTFDNSESAMNKIEIKQEPVVKEEPNDEDHLVLICVNVPMSNSIGDEQTMALVTLTNVWT